MKMLNKQPATSYQQLRQIAELLLILVILLIAGFAHGVAMFDNPFYLGDEGTYMSEAWAVVKEGRFDPYTYTYGHAPLGWVQIALWTLLVGGFHTFGTAIETGRAFMLIYQLGSTFLLYGIARKISNSTIVATITCLLFAFSPYAIYIHRRVLLDNSVTFWILLSILILLSNRLTLNRVWLSAVALGIGILSKENAIFLLPVLAYMVFYRTDPSHRWLATIGWVTIVSAMVSYYVMFAALNGELFPYGTPLGGSRPHVSMLDSLLWQAGREKDGGLFDTHSKFWHTVGIWWQAEPILIIGGSTAALLSILLIKKYRLVGLMGIATLSLWLFLMRGSLVLDFYIAPELPFMALNMALVLGVVATTCQELWQKHHGSWRLFWGVLFRGMQVTMLGLCCAGMLLEYTSPALGLQQDPSLLWKPARAVATQKAALQWIQTHIAQCNSMVIDPSMWTDLHEIAGSNGYQLSHSYWQVALDPAIQRGVFQNNWRNIDYIVATPGLLFDTNFYHLPLVTQALQNASPIVSFKSGATQIDIFQVHKGVLKPGLGCSTLDP
ncbi:MAG: glycosyltransferase family 39 protein [Chloroflexi bacterium]|nr:MAG: glycosyltransferase family 39 protein [Chloroflexota bacterium]